MQVWGKVEKEEDKRERERERERERKNKGEWEGGREGRIGNSVRHARTISRGVCARWHSMLGMPL